MAHVDMRQTTIRFTRAAGFSPIQSDDFCWSCRHDTPKPTLCCTSCVRSFHAVSLCCGSKNLSEEEKHAWKCPVCVGIEKDEQQMLSEQIDAKHVNKFLALVFEQVKCDEYLTNILMTIDYSRVNQKVSKRIDLCTIEQNINNLVYRCYDAFLSDIKWIVHNVKVHDHSIFGGDKEALKAVKWLLDVTKESIYSIRMCDECYLGLVECRRFDVVCKQPHLLVWAKQKTYPYWPAKLMSVNELTNTVEVRYFGGKHCRAILTSKECHLYTKLSDRPSLWLGAHKAEFKEAHEAIAEADLYIKQLIKVYGTFNLAAADTPLNAGMLERHLFDTIPKAWIALGKTKIPPPIPKPFGAAAATISRRHSIADSFARPPQSTTPPPSGSAINFRGITMRRMSTRLHEVDQDGDSIRNIITRRQSIQVDMFNGPSTPGSRVGIVSPLPNTLKKRKIDDDSKTNGITSKQTTSKLSDDGVFKVPAIPRKLRKVQSSDAPKIDPAILANVNAINKMATQKKANSSPPTNQHSPPNKRPAAAAASTSPPKKMNTRSKIKTTANLGTKVDAAKVEPLTEMGALFNAVIEKNTRKVTESIRTSLTDMLNEIWDASKPTQQLQKLQDQLASMRTTYGGQIDELQTENHTLKQDLDDMHGKYEVQLVKVRDTMRENIELNDILCATKSKMAVMTVDLEKSKSKNAQLTDELDEMSQLNDEWQSRVAKLKTSHGNTLKTLKKVETKMEALSTVNKTLVEKNANLNSTMQRVTNQYQVLSNQMKDVEAKCNKEKTNAYEQCYLMVSENKKKQWCVVCQEPGTGRYYCSNECEEYYWKQKRQ